MADNLIVLETHYGVVRYLYDLFRKRNNQINDLQNQVLFLRCLTKYILCRTDQYGQLYNMYSRLNSEQIRKFYEVNRLKLNMVTTDWLNCTSLVNAPRILPQSIDGPYTIDSVSLRRYSYFWTSHVTSNILATPYFCLDGIDHLYYEMIKWKTDMENIGVEMTIRNKHIFHETFYMVDLNGIVDKTKNVHIRFLIWLDDVDIQSELYVISNDGEDEDDEHPVNINSICLLKRLYIACDNNLFVMQLNNASKIDPMLKLLNMFVNRLSEHFVVSLDGKPPKITQTVVLDVTNETNQGVGLPLYFNDISRFDYMVKNYDSIYEIENIRELHLENVKTPNFLVFQEEVRAAYQPSIEEMNKRIQDLLQLLQIGVLDKSIYVRLFMRDADNLPESADKQLTILYLLKYKKFCLQREDINYNPTFFDKTYVFAAPNLMCTVKSMKYLIRDVIKSTPLLPACVYILKEQVLWNRITQNIIYMPRLQTVFFLKNYTIQSIESGLIQRDPPIDDIKSLHIVTEQLIRDELNFIFSHTGINKFDIQTITTFDDIELKCISVNRNLNFELYYFAKSIKSENINEINEGNSFKNFFMRFLHANETKQKLNDKIYTIFIHMYNLFNNNVLL
ncbi:hypothetical protein [Drosophila suzukii associated hytrosavirus 1]|nr:hypothetical protein [Drosophila suzukii associated hytrosavirus 1]